MQADLLRFGYTDSIHLLPLLHPLQAGWVIPSGLRLQLVALPALDLEAGLRRGDLDGGLVEPITYARLRGSLEVMPGIGLASEGATNLVVLQSRERADTLDGARVAVDPADRDGIPGALLAVLAEPYFGLSLTLDATPPPAGADPLPARLLAGDAAVAARRPWLLYETRFSPSTLAAEERARDKGRPLPAGALAPAPDPARAGYAEDLGAAWWVLSGAPMVWALGVLRSTLLDQPAVVVAAMHAFQQSITAAREQAPTVQATAAARAGIPAAAAQAIFDRQTVELGPRQQGGLAAFYTHTRRLRLTP